MTAMDITIYQTFLPHDDPDASLAFYRDTLGFEVPNDVIDIQGYRAVDFRAPRSSLSSTRHTGSM
jgi:catechol 2,3-dioxygenase-like lactoylglutathione lyase family enzyme